MLCSCSQRASENNPTETHRAVCPLCKEAIAVSEACLASAHPPGLGDGDGLGRGQLGDGEGERGGSRLGEGDGVAGGEGGGE